MFHETQTLISELSQTISDTFSNILLGCSIVFALLACFFGYKLSKFIISVSGFLLGAAIGLVVCALYLETDHAVVWITVISLIIGISFALLAFKLYRIGVFLYCLFFTCNTVYLLFPAGMRTPALILGIIIGIIAGVLSFRFLRELMILITAAYGGLQAARLLLGIWNYDTLWMYLAAGAALAALGTLTQFMTTKQLRHR